MEPKISVVEKLDLPFTEKEEKLNFIKIGCPSCEAQVSAENIDLSQKVGKCSTCQALFSVKDQIVSLQSAVGEKERMKRPEGVESFYFGDDLEIEMAQPFPILDTIILSSVPFILMFSTLFYFIKGFNPGLVVLSVSIILLVKSLVRYSKRKQYKTSLEINKQSVKIRFRPDNLNKTKVFSVVDIDQVYVAQGADGAVLFFIMDGPDGQRHERVLGRVSNYTHLKYIEQEIEAYLGIKDRKITGAL